MLVATSATKTKKKRRKLHADWPFRRGATLKRQGRELRYKVRSCRLVGEGWIVTLRGPYGIFDTTLDRIQKAGYIAIRRKSCVGKSGNEGGTTET